MPSIEPYTVEIQLARGTNTTPGSFDIAVIDRDRSGVRSASVVNLDVSAARLELRDGSSIAASDFCKRFLRGESAGVEQGLAFGRLLRDRLFENGNVAAFWNEIQTGRGTRRLRVELILPAAPDSALSDLPFELLVDQGSFVFLRFGNALVRTFQGFRGERLTLGDGTRVLCAWANPLIEKGNGEREPLPAALFSAHENALAELGQKRAWQVLAPCSAATRDHLADRLSRDRPALVSLIAHGSPKGGAVYLHNSGDPECPRDVGTPVSARDLAHDFKAGGVRVALLWSCHGGKAHPVSGAVAAALLSEHEGGLAAVVASHAALLADGTVPFAEALLEAWDGTAEGDLERAVTEARSRMGEGDLQWAAPVYYARPLAAESVSLEERVRAWTAAPGPAPRSHAVEGAPRRTEHFRGRESDRERLAELLRQGRLVSVVGMPGIGKTELILAVASDVAPSFERACWFSLEGHDDIEPLRDDIAKAFGRRPDDCKKDGDLAAAIGATRALLVIDNAEDLLRNPVHKLRLQVLFDAILRDCAEVRVLLSSRRLLGDLRAAREEAYRLDRLPTPHDREAFVAAAGPRLAAEERGSEELNAVVNMLEGHPQSLMLVAGQVGQGTSLLLLRERIEREGAQSIVASELLDDVDLDDVPDAQLRAKRLVSSLNLSFLPLLNANPGAAEMFTWLGHFPGGVPEVLLPEIFGEHAEERAAALERLFLVEKRGRDRRVGLPAPIRWYARDQQDRVIDQDRRTKLLLTSWETLARWLEALDRLLGTSGAMDAYERAESERETLESLVTAAIANIDGEISKQIAESMSSAVDNFSRLMRYRGSTKSALVVIEEACKKIAQLDSRVSWAKIRLSSGLLYEWTDRLEEAETAYTEALAAYLEVGNLPGQSNALWAFGELHARMDRLSEAEVAYTGALATLRATGHHLGEAHILRSLGTFYVRKDQLQEAAGAYSAALTIYRAFGNQLGETNTLWLLAEIYVRRHQLQDARSTYTEALTTYLAIGDRLGEASSLQALGELYVRMDLLAEAEAAYDDALTIYRDVGSRLGEANTLRGLGELYVRQARLPEEADAAYSEALAIYRDVGSRLGEANTLRAQGALYVMTNRVNESEQTLQRALALFQDIVEEHGEAGSFQGLGYVGLARNDAALAFSRFSEAFKIHHRIADTTSAAEDCLGLAQASCAGGYPDRGVVLAAHALFELERLESQHGRSGALLLLGEIFAALDDRQHMLAAFTLSLDIAREISSPSTASLEATLGRESPEFDPSRPFSPQQIAASERQIADVIALYAAQLAASGINPYSPLPPAPSSTP